MSQNQFVWPCRLHCAVCAPASNYTQTSQHALFLVHERLYVLLVCSTQVPDDLGDIVSGVFIIKAQLSPPSACFSLCCCSSHTHTLITSEGLVDVAAQRRRLNQRTAFLLPFAAKSCSICWSQPSEEDGHSAAPPLYWRGDTAEPTGP